MNHTPIDRPNLDPAIAVKQMLRGCYERYLLWQKQAPGEQGGDVEAFLSWAKEELSP